MQKCMRVLEFRHGLTPLNVSQCMSGWPWDVEFGQPWGARPFPDCTKSPGPRRSSYDVIRDHAVFDYERMVEYLRPGRRSYVFATLRSPNTHIVSSWDWYRQVRRDSAPKGEIGRTRTDAVPVYSRAPPCRARSSTTGRSGRSTRGSTGRTTSSMSRRCAIRVDRTHSRPTLASTRARGIRRRTIWAGINSMGTRRRPTPTARAFQRGRAILAHAVHVCHVAWTDGRGHRAPR